MKKNIFLQQKKIPWKNLIIFIIATHFNETSVAWDTHRKGLFSLIIVVKVLNCNKVMI